MKNTAVIRLVVLAAVSLLILAACDMLNSVSSSERLNLFMAELNKSDRSNLYKNLSTTAAKYAVAKPGSYWDTHFPTDGAYTSTVTATGTGAITTTLKNAGSFPSTTVTFTFTSTGLLGNIWMISTIKLGDTVIFD